MIAIAIIFCYFSGIVSPIP